MSSCCDPHDTGYEEAVRRRSAATAVCTVATMSGWLLDGAGLPTLSLSTLLVAYGAGGWDPLLRSIDALRKRKLDVDVLMLLAAVGAAVVGHWLEGAVLLSLFSLGNTLETYAFGRTRRSIRALMDLRPAEATRILNGSTERVALERLAVGDLVRISPGERIPVDGSVVEGASHVDEATLTGEPIPVAKETGAAVFAGTLNGSGSLDVRMTRAADDTTLARVIRLVEEAREARAPTQSWIQATESRYAAVVIAGSAVAVLVPWLLLGWTFDAAFYRAMTLLVVASPCALVISIPATIVSAVSNGARHGVLFKGGVHLDALADVRVVALDKTGTLTVGRPELTEIVVLSPAMVASGTVGSAAQDEVSEESVLRLVAGAESRSEHPLGGALVRAAEARDLEIPEAESFQAVPGHGVEASVDGIDVRVGRPSWVSENGAGRSMEDITGLLDRHTSPGTSPILVSFDGRVTAALSVADTVRPGAQASLIGLREAGIGHVAMLTGDAEATATCIARKLGIDEVHAELLPDGKSRVLEELRRRHGPVAMVGDGVNDAPALATADVGIALGAVGADVALETADIVVMGDNLSEIGHAIRLSQRARRIVRQNLTFSIGVMVVLVCLALTGWIGLTAGVIGHEGSTVIVVFNGLRLLTDRTLR